MNDFCPVHEQHVQEKLRDGRRANRHLQRRWLRHRRRAGFTLCCPIFWPIGLGLVAGGIGLMLAWKKRCHKSNCAVLNVLFAVESLFTLPWNTQVKAEMVLQVLAYNLKRVMNILGVAQTIKAIRMAAG
ncbi:hypothetical protein BG61_41610 [Caballeronia glathei]|uniref:Transposase DDE domain-containing protein n=1 Tax=Caballeronia glathei TaxID=60547 RepID=A0A069PCA5_9BURK|nr:hypothetical protein BG61_41610 [Caballeronia glathei]